MNSSTKGKWKGETALNLQTVTPVIVISLFMSYSSIEDNEFTGKVV